MTMQKSLSGLWRKRRHQQLCLCRRLKKRHGSTQKFFFLRECITTGEWDSAPPQYKAVTSELSILGKLVLRVTRLLILVKLGNRVVDLAHEGNQGLTKTKQTLCNMPGGLELIDKLKQNARPAVAASWLVCPHHRNP